MNDNAKFPSSIPNKGQIPADWLISGGETGELIRSMDWPATPLGLRDAWSQSLRTVVNLVLSSSYPMAILWGNELTLIYNDAYKVIAADRHPKAMGQSIREVWSEIWEYIKPVLERVIALGETVHLEDQLFLIVRNGCMEDAYFTLTYSPIHTEGQIGGTLLMLMETTQRVLLEQKLKQANAALETRLATQKQVEQALRESEERFRSITEQTRDYIGIANANGVIIYASHACNALFHCTPEEMCGCNITDFLEDPADPNVIAGFCDAIKNSGGATHLDLRFKRKDGSVFVGELNASYFQSGAQHGTLAVIRDITERKQTENELRKSQQLIEGILNAIPVRVFWKDKNLVFQGCNLAFARDSGFTDAKDIIGKDDYQMGWRNQAELYRGHDRQVIESGCAKILIEEPQTTPEGNTITLLTSKVPLRDSKGEINGILGTYLDITERKRAEEALAASEKRFRRMFQHSGAGMVLVSPDFHFLQVNDGFCKMLGYSESELLEKTFQDVTLPEDRTVGAELILKVLSGEMETFQLEKRYLHKNGTVVWGLVSSALIRDAQNKPLHFVTQIQNLTIHKQAEDERAKLKAQLHQAQKMESVGRLAGGVAHDFNNMLVVIIGHSERALGTVDPAQPLFEDLTEIRKAAQRSADLTRQLLAFARKQTVAPKVLDLNETVSGMLKMLQRIIGEDIDLNWHPSENLWPVKIDPSQVDQILANLIVNARDAIEGVGKIAIETRNSTLDETYCAAHIGAVPGEYVRLAVSDDGCGMDKDTLANIFEPFFTTKGVGKGTGLGLATVYGAVKQNHGFINAYSEPGQGTTFTIYLPQHVGKAEQSRTRRYAEPIVRGHESILLVEDELSILKLTTRVLEKQGYTVLAASTPGEAIRLAKEHGDEIHLLMTDVVMPEMNGRDLAKNLLLLYPHIKCLFTSGYTANVIAHHGVLDEGVHFIQKPFSVENLATKVRAVLDRV